MPLNAKNAPTGGKVYPPMEAGSYPARVVQVIDLGLQPQEYMGEQKTPKREVYITYEFLDEFLPNDDGEPDEEKPRWLSERFALNNLASEKAKSTQRYYALDPDEEHDGDFFALIDTPCNVTVVQNKGKDNIIRNKIANVSAMRSKDAARAPQLVNDTKVFDTEEPDLDVFNSLPKWLQDKIKENLEFEGSALDAALNGGGEKKSKTSRKKQEVVEEDEIPFDEEKEESDDW